MSRGHGAPGLVDNLRTFIDLTDDSQASRRPFLEFFPGVPARSGDWIASTGASWLFNGRISYSFAGQPLDIVGIDTALGPLTRVESLADCIATAATFFSSLNIGASSPVPTWDAASPLWDEAGATWDHQTTVDLYVHLPSDANPNTSTVVPLLGLFIGARGEVHPQLGPDKLTNGGFESLTGWSGIASPGWDDGTTLWDAVGATWDSSPTTVLDTSLFIGIGSTSSLKLATNGTVAGYAGIYQDVPTIAGQIYRLCGYYRTDAAFASGLSARLLVGNTGGTVVLYEDGRDGNANGFAALTPTAGEWRRFLFDFVAPASTTRIQLRINAAVAGAGQVNFDGVALKRIYRFVYYDPRLEAASLPELTVGSQTIFFSGKKDGQGNFSFMNSDGAFDSLLAGLLLQGRSVKAYVGGSFLDGREVYRDDWWPFWPGITQRVDVSDERVSFQGDDGRNYLQVDLPTRKHSAADEPNLNPSEENSGRALVFNKYPDPLSYIEGRNVTAIKVARVDVTASGYGIYEIGDGSRSLAGFPALQGGYGPLGEWLQWPNLWVYPNEEMANKDQLGMKSLAIEQALGALAVWYPGGPIPGPFFTYDQATGRITVVDDIRNYMLERDGTDATPRMYFDFDIGGGAIGVVPLPLGDFINIPYLSATMFAGTLQERMRFVSGAADIFVDYSHATHKWTVRKTAGTLNLRPATGQFKQLRAWEWLGFDTTTDRTGALSYTGERPTFNTPEADHVLRCVTHGLVDDATGKITGTPNAVIAKHAEVAKYILYQYLHVPLSQIDSASFAAGAALETAPLVFVCLREQMSSRDFLTRLEAGALADLLVDGDGRWRWAPYSATAPVRAAFYDRDYLSFTLSREPKNVFSSSRVTYGQNPARASEKSFDVTTDSGTPTKTGRSEVLKQATWIGSDVVSNAAAQLLGQRLGRLSTANPRLATFSARGKLVDRLVGDIITLTRSRAFDVTGALAAVRFRILDLKQNPVTGVSTCTAVEDVTFLT